MGHVIFSHDVGNADDTPSGKTGGSNSQFKGDFFDALAAAVLASNDIVESVLVQYADGRSTIFHVVEVS